MPTIKILKKSYEQIKQYPLFFFNAVKEWNYNTSENEYFWVPEAIYFSEDRNNRIHMKSIKSNHREILFAFGKPISEELSKNAIYIRIELESFDSKNVEHVRAVLSLFLAKAYNATDKYSAREFLWMLNSYSIELPVLSQALDLFDKQRIQPFFWKYLKKLSKCLSIPKQKLIQQFLSFKGVTANIYLPQPLQEALGICYSDIDFTFEDKSIFQLIEITVRGSKYEGIEFNSETESVKNPTNFFLQVRKWLSDPDYKFDDFNTLSKLFRLFHPDVQVLLVKRYFHGVRHGDYEFSQDIIKNFQVNQFENWGIYYHCAHEPSKPIRLAVQLLCDNILTFFNSGHTALQTINGTLDLAYAKCDTNFPEVDFGLKHIVPVCNGGAVPNRANFPGFICYKIVYSLNEQAFNTESILNYFRKYLNQFGSQLVEHICYNTATKPQQCQSRLADLHACDKCNYKGIQRLEKFEVKLGKENDNYKRLILSFFIDISFSSDTSILVDPEKSIIPLHVVRQRIENWFNKNFKSIEGINIRLKSGSERKLPAGWLIPKDLISDYSSLVQDFLLKSWCIIEPRYNAYIGRGILNKETGIDEVFKSKNCIKSDNDVIIQKKENAVILPRIIAALSDSLNILPNDDGLFNIPYDVELLRKLKVDFYTFKEEDNSTDFNTNNIGFMTTTISKYDRYCAPKYDNDINIVTQLPFFWCRGKECFKTSMGDQTLDSCSSWSEYTIIHLLEILGYPQIIKTNGGNEASELIRNFIGMVNQASTLFKRLKCRECNHILFPKSGASFNRYNNFECRVPTCGEKWKRIYLSQCHHCKSGLIDSRDSAQCPNGWYICPKCLSCCDDAVYERMANKYVLKHLPIPPGISTRLGHGHNDKNKYFCPKCGGEIKTVRDEHTDKIAKVCQVCRAVFEEMY